MLGIFKFFRKEKPTNTLVGKVFAQYRCADGKLTSPKGEFCYKLFEDSNKKRTYAIEIISNHELLHRYYVRCWSSGQSGGTYHEILATHHKYWNTIIKPWLDGGELSPKYHLHDGNPTYISRCLKKEILDQLKEIDWHRDGGERDEINRIAIDVIREKLASSHEA